MNLGVGLPLEELEVGLREATAAPRGAAAAMVGPVVGPVAAPAQHLRVVAWRPIHNGDCSNGVLTECCNGVLTNCAFGWVLLELIQHSLLEHD